MVDSDDELIAAAQTGERRAVDELLARYEQRIYRFGLRMCGDEEAAREVLQETMIAAFRHLPISQLPEDQREVLVLRDVEGLSAEEAADVVGIEIGALRSRLHRARMALRTKLAGAIASAPDPCPELAHELTAYAASEIDQSTCVKIEAHLASCPRCAGAYDALKRTVSMCRSVSGTTMPAPVRAAVRSAILDAIAR